MFKFRKNTKYDDEELEFKSKKIKDDLSEIYEEDENEAIDMEHLEKRPKGRLKMFFTTLFSCLFLTFIVFVIGWIIFNRPQPKQTPDKNKSMVLSVEYPENASSGERIVYKIKYENRDKVNMTKLQLLLSYPEGFIFESSTVEPENIYKTVFSLPDIGPFKTEEVEITGRLVGEEGANKNLLASLSYEPANFSSEFQELATASTNMSSAAIELKIFGAEQILPEKELEYLIKIKNKSNEDIDNLRLLAVYPEYFSVKDISPDSNSKNESKIEGLNFGSEYDVWIVSDLKKGEEREFKIRGLFSRDINEEQEIIARMEIGDEGDSYSIIAEDVLTAKSVSKDIGLNIILNGSSSEQAISLGDELNYSIIYENKGEQDLKDVKVKVHIEGYQGDNEVSLVDWDSLRDERGGHVGDGEILWTSEEILKLSSFSSGEEGAIDFFVNLKPVLDVLKKIDGNGDNLRIKSWAEMSIGSVNESEVEIIVNSNEIVANINSNLVFDSQARYFNDDNIAVGSGPIPPKVGESTKYRIFWKITNSLHKIDDISVIAKLPAGVEWSAKTNYNLGKVEYNNDSKEILWAIDSLPVEVKEANLDFEVSIIPKHDDLNKILILLSEANLSAVDSVTGAKISASDKALTTDLKDDPTVSGRGLVE